MEERKEYERYLNDLGVKAFLSIDKERIGECFHEDVAHSEITPAR